MANFGLQQFSVQQAANFDAYNDWNIQVLDLETSGSYLKSIYIEENNPAKKIVLYIEPSTTGMSELEVNDLLSLKLNGEVASNKIIKIDPNDLPFTLTGILLTSFAIKSENGAVDNHISLLSFH